MATEDEGEPRRPSHFEEPWWWVIPVHKSLDGGARLQHCLANFGTEREVSVPLHRLQDDGNRWLQPFATDAIRGFRQDR